MKKETRFIVNEEGELAITAAFTEKPEDELCDFCSALKPPYKVYKCPDFPHPMCPLQWSRGEWNACAACAELVDAEDKEGLIERCKIMHSFDYDELDTQLLRAFHEEFFRLRIR